MQIKTNGTLRKILHFTRFNFAPDSSKIKSNYTNREKKMYENAKKIQPKIYSATCDISAIKCEEIKLFLFLLTVFDGFVWKNISRVHITKLQIISATVRVLFSTSLKVSVIQLTSETVRHLIKNCFDEIENSVATRRIFACHEQHWLIQTVQWHFSKNKDSEHYEKTFFLSFN